jgi:hypothetical protein
VEQARRPDADGVGRVTRVERLGVGRHEDFEGPLGRAGPARSVAPGEQADGERGKRGVLAEGRERATPCAPGGFRRGR